MLVDTSLVILTMLLVSLHDVHNNRAYQNINAHSPTDKLHSNTKTMSPEYYSNNVMFSVSSLFCHIPNGKAEKEVNNLFSNNLNAFSLHDQ